MGFVRSLSKSPAIIPVVLFLLCITASAYFFVQSIVPEANRLIDRGLNLYDEHFPTISIQDGKASVDVEQPWRLDSKDADVPVVIIDTREETDLDPQSILKKHSDVVILTRDMLFLKNKGEIRIIDLKNVPDFVINSENLRDLKKRMIPKAATWAVVLLSIYFFLSKTVQVLLFALIPLLVGKSGPEPPTYGASVKLAVYAMVPAVIVGSALFMSSVSYVLNTLVYLVVFLAVLILFSVALRSGKPEHPTLHGSIRP